MRSTRPDVRNPLLQLKSARQLGEWLDAGTAQVLAIFLRDLSEDARRRAAESWKSHKAPMALYWKVVAVYARHLAQICRGIQRQAIAEGVPGKRAQLERVMADVAYRLRQDARTADGITKEQAAERLERAAA